MQKQHQDIRLKQASLFGCGVPLDSALKGHPWWDLALTTPGTARSWRTIFDWIPQKRMACKRACKAGRWERPSWGQAGGIQGLARPPSPAAVLPPHQRPQPAGPGCCALQAYHPGHLITAMLLLSLISKQASNPSRPVQLLQYAMPANNLPDASPKMIALLGLGAAHHGTEPYE